MERPLQVSWLAGLMLVGLTACDSLLDVPGPPVVPPSVLDDPAFAPTMVQGAVADFECALANYIVATGLLTDELQASSSLGGVVTWDRRTAFESGGTRGCIPDNSLSVGVYAPLATARFQADDALRRLRDFPDTALADSVRRPLMALAAAYAGYSYTLIGEGFCEAAFDLGDALPWHRVLALAEQRFDTALALAREASIDSVVSLALVGRSRVRLDLGNLAGAADDARLVSEDFLWLATYSMNDERRWNRVFAVNTDASVDPRFRDREVDGIPDPRVLVASDGRQAEYVSRSSPIIMASWREAQLIVAEAADGQEVVERINTLRAFWQLPAFAGNDPDSIVQQVRVERQRELFLQGHRLNDMLRFQVPFDTVDRLGVPTGNLTCLRLPSVEVDNNPNITGPRRTTRD